VKNKIKFFLLLIFVYSCSLDTKSGFWTKTEKLDEDKKIKKLFVEKKVLEQEFNTKIKIKIKNQNIKNSFLNNNSNNNSSVNFTGNLKKSSKYKFKKINDFDQLKPELSFTKNNSIIFFDNKGSIIKFDENSNLEWKVNIYNKKEIKLKPVLHLSNNGKFLIAVDSLGKYYAINIINGNLIWSKKNDAPFNSQVKILNDKFFAVDYTDTLICFSLKNGKIIWKSTSESSLIKSKDRLSLVVSDEFVIYQNSLSDLVAVDTASGDLIWQTPIKKNYLNQNIFTIKSSDLVLHNNSIYFSNDNNSFYSIDAKNGVINWQQNVNSNLRPTIIEGLVFTITLEGYLVIIDSRNGNILRITNIFDQIKYSKRKNVVPVGFVISNNKIYLSLKDGRMIIVDIINGKSIDIIKLANSKISRPHILDKNMYLIKDDAIIKIN
tara:strand:- start:41 stop:1342 length:1302 start_codon:yes stop_codon:yes gene_type:complete